MAAMLSSVLIANRGEIACRIIRTAKRLGIRTIAVTSNADCDAPHVRMADAVCGIGPPEAARSYLNIDAILDAARRERVEAIHPGYGFLSENPDFAEACAAAGVTFVGPSPEAMRAMGLKDRAKKIMAEASVPVVPGYSNDAQDAESFTKAAKALGYPLLIKPVAGGGGKGMRRVERAEDFRAAFAGAQREAQAFFGDPRVLIERWIASPRHIEIQVFGDRHGNVVHLNERDCTLQRRHQKLIEECPAPGMDVELRAQLGAIAVKAARAVNYEGAGTVEFIADAFNGLRADACWFLEMNVRLQVEHPVTEAVTGLDLVEWQFRVAAGEPLPLKQSEIRCDGHAVEARVCAEDPANGFLPSTGKLSSFVMPAGEGVRVDDGFETGQVVTPYYDSLLAKVIAHAPTREVALDRLAGALDRTLVTGPRTNLALLAGLCRAEPFRSGAFDTGFIDANLTTLVGEANEMDRGAAAFGVRRLLERRAARSEGPPQPWDATDGFVLGDRQQIPYTVSIDGALVTAHASSDATGIDVLVGDWLPANDAVAVDAGDAVHVLRHGRQTIVSWPLYDTTDDSTAGDGVLRAPMSGKVLAITIAVGEEVAAGQKLVVVEAMKMEHAMAAPFAGRVAAIAVGEGQAVGQGAALVTVERDPV